MGSAVRTARDADMAFVAEVYERHKGIMYKTAIECIGDDADKTVVVHDAIVRLVEHADTLRKLNESALAVYVAATVRSVALNRERRKSLERRLIMDVDISEVDDIDSGPTYEERFIEEEAHRDRLRYLREALSELSDTDRELLVGKYMSGESDESLAKRFGVSPESIRMKLTRARRRAKKIIERKESGHA